MRRSYCAPSTGSRRVSRSCRATFPDWKFEAPDCTAAFGLHAALLVGTPVPVTDANRAALAAALPRFELTLRNGDAVIDRGVGANVLDSPALALAHLARVLAGQPQFARLAAGEIVTTGTVTDAWPVARGQAWSSDYGTLGCRGCASRFPDARLAQGALVEAPPAMYNFGVYRIARRRMHPWEKLA